MTEATETEDIRKVIEAVRTEIHPQLSAKFMSEVIEAEARNPDDDDAALREIAKALDATLAS